LTDAEILAEIERQGQILADGRDCTVYLCPSDRVPHKESSAGYEKRELVTDGDPILDLEIWDSDARQIVFIRTIGPQAALDAVPYAEWVGNRTLPQRIFASGDFFLDDYQRTELFPQSYSLYTELCSTLRPKSIFEIGVRAGYSAWAMLRGCAAGTIYHGIDIADISYANGMLYEEYPEHVLRLARCDSGTLTHLSQTYDLAHVDGNHSHEGALHDINLCWGRAKYILIDDVTAYCTVNSAVNEWLAKYPGIQAVRYATQTGHVMLGPLPHLFGPRDMHEEQAEENT
jgi:hypothetical protein